MEKIKTQILFKYFILKDIKSDKSLIISFTAISKFLESVLRMDQLRFYGFFIILE